MDNVSLKECKHDSLLSSLIIVAEHYGCPHKASLLTANLPLVDSRLTPELFIRAAKRAGLVSKLVKRKLHKISPLILPAVINLKQSQSVVLLSVDKKQKEATIFSSETAGEVKVPFKVLKNKYNGTLFLISKEFNFDNRDPELLQDYSGHWFWGTLTCSWRIYRDVLLASFMLNMFALATPFFVMNVYDRVVPNEALETLWVLSTGVIVIYFFDFIIKIFRAYFVDIAAKKSDILLSSNIFEKVMGMRLADRPISVGSFASNLRDFDNIRDFFTSVTVTTLIDIPFISIFIFVIYFIAGDIAYIPLVAVVTVLFYSLIIQPFLKHSVDKVMRASSQKQANLIEALSSIETVKTLGLQGQLQQKWENASSYIADWSLKSKVIAFSGSAIAQLMQQGTTVVIVFAGVYAIAENELSLGGLIASIMLSNRALAPMTQTSNVLTKYHNAKAALGSLNKIMRSPDERKNAIEYVHPKKITGKISFENVNFSYSSCSNSEENLNTLENVSFDIKQGEHVAVLGAVGSGKTTILKLILRLYDPDSGKIKIDDISINQIDPIELRKSISYVSQSPALFYGTLRENIVSAKPLATDDEVLSAVKMSGVLNFIKNHPSGFDMNVGEGGQNLSLGQRQCVAIARALLSDSSIVLLDEPTSSIDNTIEKLLIESFSSYTQEKTLILITHRKTLLNLVEKILVINNGKIINFGSKDQVLESVQKGFNNA